MDKNDGRDERTVVVSGGGTGIGKAIAARFARAGEHVVLLGRRTAVLQQAADDIGGHVTSLGVDVSKRAEVETAVSQLNQIDVLVNNAGFVRGVSANMPLAEAEARWDEVLNSNLKGSFLLAVAASKKMQAGGRIINVSSIAAYTGGSRGGAIEYAASKAGLHGLTMGLARDLGDRGITVNAVAPGLIAKTEFTGAWPESRFANTVTQQANKQVGQPDDIAAATIFLASPDAQFITGEVLNVNGGWLFGR